MKVDGAELHVEDTGGSGPAIAFSHGLLWSTTMWRFQIAAFRDAYRCIAWDHRGQGKSEVTASGYDMDTLAQDAAAVIERLGAAPVDFVGLSMGGFVGMRLAARRPELVRTLALLDTAADTEPLLNRPRYALMALLAQLIGTAPLVRPVMQIMFGRAFREDPSRAQLRADLIHELSAMDLGGMKRAVFGVIRREPVAAEELAKIRCPTLVISGEEDAGIAPARSRRLLAQLPGARWTAIPRAGHTSSIEEPEAVNAALRQFWAAVH